MNPFEIIKGATAKRIEIINEKAVEMINGPTARQIGLNIGILHDKAVMVSSQCGSYIRKGKMRYRQIKKIVSNKRWLKVSLLLTLATLFIALLADRKKYYFGRKSMNGGVLGAYVDHKFRRHVWKQVFAKRKALLEELGLPLARLHRSVALDAMSWSIEVLIRRFRRKKVMALVEASAMNWDTDCPSPFPKRILQANVGSSFRPFVLNDSYDLVAFDLSDLRGLIKQFYPQLLTLFDALRHHDLQVLLWSICAVHRYGGVVFGPTNPSRNVDGIEKMQKLMGSPRGKCVKMGFVQYDEKGYLNLIAAPPQHPILQCVIESLEKRESLAGGESTLVFFLGHPTEGLDADKGKKLLLTFANTANNCQDTNLAPLSEISILEDPGSEVLYLERVSTTFSTVSSPQSISVSISANGNLDQPQKSSHQSLLRSVGCEPGWLCDRCVKASLLGTYEVCSIFCNTCYTRSICESGDYQKGKTILEVDVNVNVPPPRVGQRMIPRIIHQTWFEDITPTHYPQLYRFQNSWRNSGWEYRFYNDTEVRSYIQDNFPARFLESYDALVPGAFKADLFRYLVLLRDGGLYVDVDLLLETNLDTFITPTLSFLTARDDGIATAHDQPFCLWNGIIAAAPGHPVIAKAVERLINLVLMRADLFDMEREMCRASGKLAEAWKIRLVPILLVSGPCALGAATNQVIGRNSHLERLELGWIPFNTSGVLFPRAFSEGLLLKNDKFDFEAHRFTDIDRNIMFASTDVPDLAKDPLFPPEVRPQLRHEPAPKRSPHYSYLEFIDEVFGSQGVYIDDQVQHEVVKLMLHYHELQ